MGRGSTWAAYPPLGIVPDITVRLKIWVNDSAIRGAKNCSKYGSSISAPVKASKHITGSKLLKCKQRFTRS